MIAWLLLASYLAQDLSYVREIQAAREMACTRLPEGAAYSGVWKTEGGHTEFMFPIGKSNPMVIVAQVSSFAPFGPPKGVDYKDVATFYTYSAGRLTRIGQEPLVDADSYAEVRRMNLNGTICRYLLQDYPRLVVPERSRTEMTVSRILLDKGKWVTYQLDPVHGEIISWLVDENGVRGEDVAIAQNGKRYKLPLHPFEVKYLRSKIGKSARGG